MFGNSILFNLFNRGLRFSTDGGGTGDDTGKDDAKTKADADAKAKEEADVKAKADADAKKTGGADEKKFSQDDVDRVVKERLERAEKKAKEDTEKARKKAEEDALEKNKEFEQLAITRLADNEKLKADNEELQKSKEQGEKYKAALEKDLKARIGKLSKPIQNLMEKLDPLEQIEFLTKNSKELGVKIVEGIDETPNGDETKLTKEQELQARKVSARTTQQNF